MKKLFCILSTYAMGLGCVYGAMLGINDSASVLFCIGAALSFLIGLGFAAEWAGFTRPVDKFEEED